MFCRTFRIFLFGSLFLSFALSFTLAQEQSQGPLTYENEELGVRITGPNGWYLFQPKNLTKKKFGVHVVYSRYPVGSTEEDNPRIILEVEPVTQNKYKMPLEHAKYYVSVIRDEKDIMGIIDIEEPTLVNINNQEGARYAYETKTLEENGEKKLKYLEYIFTKGDFVCLLHFECRVEYLDKHTKEFEEVINTFVLK